MDNEELQEETSEVTTPTAVGLYAVEFNLSSYSYVLFTNIVESCECNHEITRVVNYSRDGTAYIQDSGPRKKTYSVICYGTKTQVAAIEESRYYGSLMCVVMSGGESVSYGRITEFSKQRMFEENNLVFDGTSWEEYYKMEFTMVYQDAPSTTTGEEAEEEPSEETQEST